MTNPEWVNSLLNQIDDKTGSDVMTEPTWYKNAKGYIGTREIVGPKHSPVIMGWIKRLGAKLGVTIKDDETPWCGTFITEVMDEAKIKAPKYPIRAKSWATWGKAVTSPMMGCVLVFQRTGGGHVGLCSGFTATHFRVLGGNQGNAVSHTWIERSRCIAMRWPTDTTEQPSPALRFTSINGAVSTNEA